MSPLKQSVAFALALGCCLPAAGAVPATTAPADAVQATPAADHELIEGIRYAQRGARALNLDLARPKTGEGPFPAIVCLFGGGWISGHRGAVRPHLTYFAPHGYVVVAPDYRLAPDDPFPAAVADVRACVRWLRRNADSYNIDPERIAAMGFSAGGHLACMLGVAPDTHRFGPDEFHDDGVSARVQAVVNYFGPGDLAADDWSALAVRKYLVPFLQGTPDEQPEAYRQASPITQITPDDAPVLTFQGDADRTVPPSQAKNLHAELDEKGVDNTLVIIEGAGHGWGEPTLEETRQQALRFLARHLRHGPRAVQNAGASAAEPDNGRQPPGE